MPLRLLSEDPVAVYRPFDRTEGHLCLDSSLL